MFKRNTHQELVETVAYLKECEQQRIETPSQYLTRASGIIENTLELMRDPQTYDRSKALQEKYQGYDGWFIHNHKRYLIIIKEDKPTIWQKK